MYIYKNIIYKGILNSIEEVLHIPLTPRLEPHQFNGIPRTVNGFQLLLSNTNNSIQHYSFFYTQLNSFKYCFLRAVEPQPLSYSTLR